jgi:hypothetical protein
MVSPIATVAEKANDGSLSVLVAWNSSSSFTITHPGMSPVFPRSKPPATWHEAATGAVQRIVALASIEHPGWSDRCPGRIP